MHELESTANTSDFALAHQSYAIRNMMSRRVLIAGKYAREDVGKQGFKNMQKLEVLCCWNKTRGFVLLECGVRQENITKPLGFMVSSQEGAAFIGICSTSYTSRKTQNPDSRGLLLCFGGKLWISCVDA